MPRRERDFARVRGAVQHERGRVFFFPRWPVRFSRRGRDGAEPTPRRKSVFFFFYYYYYYYYYYLVACFQSSGAKETILGDVLRRLLWQIVDDVAGNRHREFSELAVVGRVDARGGGFFLVDFFIKAAALAAAV